MNVPIDKIIPNPDQPRTIFDQAELENLAATIKEHGVILPISVEQVDDYYILVDGERRWRAARMAGLLEIPAAIQERTNHNGIERLTRALIANIQRSDMGPVDEGNAYKRLLDDLGSQQAVADKVRVSVATVSMRLALLDFPDEVQRLFNLRRLRLDPKVVAALKQLSKSKMTKVALQAATRGGTSRVIIGLIRNDLASQGRKYSPRARTTPEPVLVDGHFSASSLIAEKKIPEGIREAAIKTCQSCALYSEACHSVCRECPLPDLLRRI